MIEEAIGVITGEDVRTDASGRTDAGAHALGQVLAFSTKSKLPADTLRRAMNAHLPDDIALTAATDVAPGFHPRRDARSRIYRYLMWNRPARSPMWQGQAVHIPRRLDERLMNEGAQHFVGEHDFSAFVPLRQVGSRVRRVDRAACTRDGDLISFEIEGNGFMRQMVRSMAGTLIRVGLRKLSVSDVSDIVASRTRTEAGDTAPAHGLYLVEVRYAPQRAAHGEQQPGVQSRRIEETT